MNISQASPLKELDDGEEMGNRNTPACRSKRKLSGSEGRGCQETDNARAGWKSHGRIRRMIMFARELAGETR